MCCSYHEAPSSEWPPTPCSQVRRLEATLPGHLRHQSVETLLEKAVDWTIGSRGLEKGQGLAARGAGHGGLVESREGQPPAGKVVRQLDGLPADAELLKGPPLAEAAKNGLFGLALSSPPKVLGATKLWVDQKERPAWAHL